MPELIPSRKFLEDIEKFRSDSGMRKKIAKTLALLEHSPLHPGLHIERIVNVLKHGLSVLIANTDCLLNRKNFCLREIRTGLPQFCSYAL